MLPRKKEGLAAPTRATGPCGSCLGGVAPASTDVSIHVPGPSCFGPTLVTAVGCQRRFVPTTATILKLTQTSGDIRLREVMFLCYEKSTWTVGHKAREPTPTRLGYLVRTALKQTSEHSESSNGRLPIVTRMRKTLLSFYIRIFAPTFEASATSIHRNVNVIDSTG